MPLIIHHGARCNILSLSLCNTYFICCHDTSNITIKLVSKYSTIHSLAYKHNFLFLSLFAETGFLVHVIYSSADPRRKQFGSAGEKK